MANTRAATSKSPTDKSQSKKNPPMKSKVVATKRKVDFKDIPSTSKQRRLQNDEEESDSDFETVSDNKNKKDNKIALPSRYIRDGDYFIKPNEHFSVKVQHFEGVNVISNIKKILSPQNLEKFSTSCFGFFLKMNDYILQPQLVHSLLLREIKQPNYYELWINVSGKLLKFSLDEFAVVTGLNCTENVDMKLYKKSDSDFKLNCFGNITKVSKKNVEDSFLLKRWSSEEESFKLAVLYFVELFLYNNQADAIVRDEHINIVGNGEYENFAWGKDVFHCTIEFLKSKLSSVKRCDFLKKNKNVGVPPNTCRYDGFPLAFQCWFFECCPASNGTLAECSGSHIPRILKWKITELRQRKYLDRHFFSQSAEKLKLSNLHPTAEERSVLNLGGMFLKKKRKAPIEETMHGGNVDASLHEKIKKLDMDQTSMYTEFTLFKSFVENKFSEVVGLLGDLKSLVSNSVHNEHVKEDDSDYDEQTPDASDDETTSNSSEKEEDSRLEGHDIVANVNETIDSTDQNDQGKATDQGTEHETALHEESKVSEQGTNHGHQGIEHAGQEKETEQGTNHEHQAKESETALHEDQGTEQPGHEQVAEKVVAFDELQCPSLFDDIDPSALHKAADIVEREFEISNATEDPPIDCTPVAVYVPRRKVKGLNPLDDNLGSITHSPQMDAWLAWIDVGFKRNNYAPADNILDHGLNLGVLTIYVKLWWHSLVYRGVFLDDTHIDVGMYFIRKKAKYNPHNGLRITTTDCLFDDRIQGLFMLYTKNKGDTSTVADLNIAADYVQGYGILCNTPWKDVDEVLFPMHLTNKKHWVLGRFVFKDRCVYVYNSLDTATSKKESEKAAKKYSVVLPRIFALLDIYNLRTDIDLQSPAYRNKLPDSPFSVSYVTDLPIQKKSDCGAFVLAFAEHLIRSQPIPSEFLIESHRERIAYLFFKYATMKHDNNIDSDEEVEPKPKMKGVIRI
ncbi:uncharacterized protein LOC126665110 [Mercurialis annua]|uniref:uncharacterized protein LOC126665110 n=1 Tax=Mercurialis annua TaxID=3986 RepID=UPI00215DE4B0|nr:uncharacterized protein LOC126665110 [Mercurialis annua]